MNTTTKPVFIVNRLVPMWNTMRSKLVKPVMAELRNPGHGFNVKQAGRALTMKDYQQLENINSLEGGGSNVAIQFGFLGGIGGVGVLGESPG
jgi:hypothetical protein